VIGCYGGIEQLLMLDEGFPAEHASLRAPRWATV